MCPCSRWREMKGWNKKAFNFKIQQKESPPSQIETVFMFSSLNNGCVLKFNVAIQIFMLWSNINKGNLLETIQGNNTSTQKSLKFWEKKRGWEWGFETSVIEPRFCISYWTWYHFCHWYDTYSVPVCYRLLFRISHYLCILELKICLKYS